jgi:hypothetical protein
LFIFLSSFPSSSSLLLSLSHNIIITPLLALTINNSDSTYIYPSSLTNCLETPARQFRRPHIQEIRVFSSDFIMNKVSLPPSPGLEIRPIHSTSGHLCLFVHSHEIGKLYDVRALVQSRT